MFMQGGERNRRTVVKEGNFSVLVTQHSNGALGNIERRAHVLLKHSRVTKKHYFVSVC